MIVGKFILGMTSIMIGMYSNQIGLSRISCLLATLLRLNRGLSIDQESSLDLTHKIKIEGAKHFGVDAAILLVLLSLFGILVKYFA